MSAKLVYLICLVLALGLALTSTASAADPSLLAWWKLDDGSGNIAVDSSDYGNHGTLNGGPQWVAGKIGGALQLDGVDDFVERRGSLTVDNEVTVMLWLNAERIGGGTGGDYGGLVTKGSGSRVYNFYMNAPNKLHFSVGPAGGWVNSWSTGTFVPNEWTHVVAQVVDGHHQYYINGQDAGTGGEGSTLPTSTDPVYIGSAPEGTYSKGMFDDVRIYNRALSQQEIQEVMKGAFPSLAWNPSPKDNGTLMPLDTDLSWESGDFAVSHDVYFGESLEDVNTATLGDDAFQVNQTANTFDPGALAYDKTYFWRIDEVNEADPNSPWKGETWNFTTEPYLFTLPAECIDVDASSYHSDDTVPENTINGSGLDESGLLHSSVQGTMWVTAASGPQPAWIEFTFDRDYALYEMDVWNHNSLRGLFGIQEALIETATDGGEYTTLGTYTFTKAPGANGYAANTTVDLGGLAAGKVRITAQSGYLDAVNVGLSEVQFRYLPVRASDLSLADGTAGVPVDETLDWRAGRQAVVHEIWLGTDADDLALVDTVSDTQYNLGSLDLTLGQTYCYQIVELNEAETPARWATSPMSFTVVNTLVVDDMESYNSLNAEEEGSRRIFNIWADGYGKDDNGSQLGRPESPLDPPFVEQSLVRSGRQAMSLLYDNTTAPKSEVTATTADLGGLSDWTGHGINTLSLWFHGDPNNASQQLYVTINGVKVPYEEDAENLTRAGWQTWTIDLSDRAVDNVSEIGIGLERINGTGGSGVLYVDDLRLSIEVEVSAIFFESFDGIAGGNFNGGQFESNLDLAWGADLPGWSKAGAGAMHVVDHANVTGNIVNPRNFAPILWGANTDQTIENANIITLDSPIEGSNTSGQVYEVSFLASPSVYQMAGQASQDTEGVLIEVLRGDDTVLASYTSLPGAWAGDMAFVADSFQYTGDGSGDIRFRISPSNPNVGRFGAAIDDLTLNFAPPLFTENFDGIAGGNFNGGQFGSNLDLAWGADLPGWSKAGNGAVHIVDHANVTGNIVNPRNFAPMMWGANTDQTIENANIITLDSPIVGSNTSGQVYEVSFLASPCTYQNDTQASQDTEGVLIEVLRGDDTVLASYASLPGAWAGDMAFVADSFQYTGDGSGDIRFRISPSNPNVGRFGAAIDDLTLTTAPVGP